MFLLVLHKPLVHIIKELVEIVCLSSKDFRPTIGLFQEKKRKLRDRKCSVCVNVPKFEMNMYSYAMAVECIWIAMSLYFKEF